STFLTNSFRHSPSALATITAHLDANQRQLRQLVRNPFLLQIVVEVFQSKGQLPSTRGELFREFSCYLQEWGLQREPDTQLLKELLPEQRITDLTVYRLDLLNRQRVFDRLTSLVEPVLGRLAFAMFTDPAQGTEANLEWILSQLPPQTTSPSFN